MMWQIHDDFQHRTFLLAYTSEFPTRIHNSCHSNAHQVACYFALPVFAGLGGSTFTAARLLRGRGMLPSCYCTDGTN